MGYSITLTITLDQFKEKFSRLSGMNNIVIYKDGGDIYKIIGVHKNGTITLGKLTTLSNNNLNPQENETIH